MNDSISDSIAATNGMVNSSKPINEASQKDAFSLWMTNVKHLSQSTIRSYTSAVKTIGEFAVNASILETPFYCLQDVMEIQRAVNKLFLNKSFISINDAQHNRFAAALNKYLEFTRYDNGEAVELVTANSQDFSIVSKKQQIRFVQILCDYFVRGFRLSSPIEVRRFRNFYETHYDEQIVESDDTIQKVIGQICVEYQGRAFLPQNIIDERIKERIIGYIADAFTNGTRIIYYDSLYDIFAEDLQTTTLYTPEMLKQLLTFYNEGQYYLYKNYLTAEVDTQIDAVEEVRRFLKMHGTITTYDEIAEQFPHIPLSKIKQILGMNAEFISAARDGRGLFIHINCVYLDQKDLQHISSIINAAIDKKHYIAGNELTGAIANKYPEIIDKNADLPPLGLRNAIAYHLKSQYSFVGNIISSYDSPFSMSSIFEEYCKQNETVTLDELNVLKNELNSVIYFDTVYENKLRVSKDLFVKKDAVIFDVERTDAAIDRFCEGDYIPISAIKQFSLFPGVEYPWTNFLLEGYVHSYSHEYMLLNVGFNANTCVGAIVKRGSKFREYEQVITDAIAKSHTQLNTTAALDYLCVEGYLARRNLSSIEQILVNAKLLRERKEK